jgi:hypothetical protein
MTIASRLTAFSGSYGRVPHGGICQTDMGLGKLGYSQGGFSTKIHLRCEDSGKPVTFLLTVGQRHEAVMFELLVEQGAVKREGPGRPRLRPERVAGDIRIYRYPHP